MVVDFTGEFAFGMGVPKFDVFISSGRDNLSVARRETASKDFFVVSVELFGGNSSS